MAPFFKQLEDHALGEDELRGVGGPIAVKTHSEPSRLGNAFIAAGEAMGLPVKQDQNRLDQMGIGYLQLNIDRRGRRVSAARGFLDPARRRANLKVVTQIRVDRVLIEGNRAVGVSGVSPGGPSRFQSAGEVILCANAINSPKLLQLSGIGPGALLQKLGIPVIADSPRVGQNLQEHLLVMLDYRLRNRCDSQNHQFRGLPLILNTLRYLATGTGVMSHGSYEAAAFVNAKGDSNRPDCQIMFAPFSYAPDKKLEFEREPGMHLFSYALRPDSRGKVEIQSPDPALPPLINPNYLSAPHDRDLSIASVRYMRRLAAQAPLLPLIEGETSRTAGAQSDPEIIELFERFGVPGFHACGTCAIGPGGVVNSRLRVHAVDRLRVMDTSVFPTMVSGNTNAPTLAMALRAAKLILEDRR
jgi:choline dehydrogenase-like flavoprotein